MENLGLNLPFAGSNNNSSEGVFETTGRFVKEKPVKVAKWVYNIIDWLRIWGVVNLENAPENNIHFQAKCFQRICLGPLGLIAQGQKIYRAQIRVLGSGKFSDAGDLYLCLNGLVSRFYSSAVFWNRAVGELPINLIHSLKKREWSCSRRFNGAQGGKK